MAQETATGLEAYQGLVGESAAGLYASTPLQASPDRLYNLAYNSTAPRAQSSRTAALQRHDLWLEKPHWTETTNGRMAVEFFSRMTLGALFFSAMENSRAMQSMKTYRPEDFEFGKSSWLEHAAKLADTVIGRPMVAANLKFLVPEKNQYGVQLTPEERLKIAREPLKFRENKLGTDGRSLGAEMTIVTAGFAGMSAGTAIMRNLLNGIFNPKERESWKKDGRFDPVHSVKKLGAKAWEILSYNAGEDIAVALPYVFVMKGSRNLLNKIYPGFNYGADHVDNGGSFRVNDNANVTGHYTAAGALDLQGRFTIYNVFTQLYRDVYNATALKFKNWNENGRQLALPDALKHPLDIPGNLIDATGKGARYVAISSIRSILQMTPAVPFFSLFRVPPNRMNGLFIHPDKGPVAFKRMTPDGKEVFDPLVAHRNFNGAQDPRYHTGEQLWFAKTNEKVQTNSSRSTPASDFINGDKFQPFDYSKPGHRLSYSTALKAADTIGGTMLNAANGKPGQNPIANGFFSLIGYRGDSEKMKNERHIRSRDALLAGIPYAAYFSAKVAARETYVNDQMNMAIGRAIDGITHLHWREFAEGVSETARTMMRLPFKDPERQAVLVEMHRQNPGDNSPIPHNWSVEEHKAYIADNSKAPSEERIARLEENFSAKRRDEFSNRRAAPTATRQPRPQSRGNYRDQAQATQDSQPSLA